MFGMNEQLNPEYEYNASNRSGTSKVQINTYKDKQVAFQKPLFHIQDDIKRANRTKPQNQFCSPSQYGLIQSIKQKVNKKHMKYIFRNKGKRKSTSKLGWLIR
jgi:hypothetical protein